LHLSAQDLDHRHGAKWLRAAFSNVTLAADREIMFSAAVVHRGYGGADC